MNRNQIIKSAVFGHVIGDALGVPVEFISREKLDRNPVNCMLGNGTHRVPKGTWSDDSAMMLCTMASMTEKKEIDYHDIMHRFSLWAKDGYMTPYGKPFGIGRSTLKSIGRYWRGEDALKCGCSTERDNGNGSLMRILPIALYCSFNDELELREKIEHLHMVSALTHAHEISCTACGIFYFILNELVHTTDRISIKTGLEKAKEYYKNNPSFSAYQRLFSSGFFETPRDEIKSSGYVIDTLEAALWCVYRSADYQETVLTAVNLGDDTDTIAAIAGSLAGILYGLDSMPKEWMDEIAERDMILRMCEEFYGMN